MAINLRLSGDGFSVEREVTLTQAGKILTFLGSEAESPISASEYPVATAFLGDVADAVTNTGAKPKKKRGKRTASNSPAQTQISEEVLDIGIVVPDMDDYPNYHKLPTKGQKIMWILAFAQDKGIDSLRPNEISYIATKLKDRIAPGDLNALTTSAAKQSLLAKDGSKYVLLHKGIEVLKALHIENPAE